MQALLIGIDHYLPNPWCGDLHGAVADAMAIRQHLLSIGVSEQKIRCLVSPRPDHSQPLEDQQLCRPSWGAMVEAILELGDRAAQAGEGALLYFSGHGGQAKTWLPEVKGRQGIDEGLVPWDLEPGNTRLLRDVELTWLLDQIVRRGVAMTVILDSCHGAGMLRSSGRRVGRHYLKARAVKRGGGQLGSLIEGESQVATLGELARTWGFVHHRAQGRLPDPKTPRHSRSKGGWVSARLVKGAGVVMISACRSGDLAYERDFGEGPRGVFTWHLLSMLQQVGRKASWEQVWRQLARNLRRLRPPQRPIFEGDLTTSGAGLLQPTVPESLEGTREIGLPNPEMELSAGWCSLREAFARRALESDLEARWAILDGGYRRGSPLLLDSLRFETGRPRVPVGRWIALEVANLSLRTLYLGVLDLRPDGTIEVVYPLRGVELIRGRWWRRVPLEIYLPEGHPGGPETLVAIASPEPLDLQFFQRPDRRLSGESCNSLMPAIDPNWGCALVDFEVSRERP